METQDLKPRDPDPEPEPPDEFTQVVKELFGFLREVNRTGLLLPLVGWVIWQFSPIPWYASGFMLAILFFKMRSRS